MTSSDSWTKWVRGAVDDGLGKDLERNFNRNPVLVSPFGGTNGRIVIVPFWMAVLSTGSLATAPWVRWSKRFRVRTLLIATTLVAVVLGLIVWLR